MSELKLCPFCGSKTIFSKGGLFAKCSNPKCVLSKTVIFLPHWQTRPLEDALSKQLDELIQMVHKIYKGREILDTDYCTMDNAIDDAENYCSEIERLSENGETSQNNESDE
jgi:hypothetical protein